MEKPWIEKYRPTNINDIVLSDYNKKIIFNMIKSNYYPNTILYGPPGTGKTTTILCIINEYQKIHKCKHNYIHLNASHERGINIIRNEIDPNLDFIYRSLPQDDPLQRQPVIALAQQQLGWNPSVPLDAGLDRTIADFRARLTAAEGLLV